MKYKIPFNLESFIILEIDDQTDHLMLERDGTIFNIRIEKNGMPVFCEYAGKPIKSLPPPIIYQQPKEPFLAKANRLVYQTLYAIFDGMFFIVKAPFKHCATLSWMLICIFVAVAQYPISARINFVLQFLAVLVILISIVGTFLAKFDN